MQLFILIDDDKRKCLSQSENNVRIMFVKHLIISTHLILCPSSVGDLIMPIQPAMAASAVTFSYYYVVLS